MVSVSTGAAIKRAREAKGLTQPELGALIGVTFATVSRWELGAYEVPKRNLFALKAVLGPLAGTVKDQSKRQAGKARKPLNHNRRG